MYGHDHVVAFLTSISGDGQQHLQESPSFGTNAAPSASPSFGMTAPSASLFGMTASSFGMTAPSAPQPFGATAPSSSSSFGFITIIILHHRNLFFC